MTLYYKFINTVKGVCITSLLVATLSRALSFIRLVSLLGAELNTITKGSHIVYEYVVHNTTHISALPWDLVPHSGQQHRSPCKQCSYKTVPS